MNNFKNFELTVAMQQNILGGKGKPDFAGSKPSFASEGTPDLSSFVENPIDFVFSADAQIPETVELPDLTDEIALVKDLLPVTGRR